MAVRITWAAPTTGGPVDTYQVAASRGNETSFAFVSPPLSNSTFSFDDPAGLAGDWYEIYTRNAAGFKTSAHVQVTIPAPGPATSVAVMLL
jgi:hypothetical protein